MVELWSCLKKSNVKKSKNKRYNYDGTNSFFTIDKRPNLKYLRTLRSTSAKYVEKEKRRDLSRNKITSELYKSVKKSTLKCSHSSQRKRQHEDNLDSNLAKSNIHHSKKKAKSERTKNTNENSSQTNSMHKLREIIVDGCNVAMAYDSFL